MGVDGSASNDSSHMLAETRLAMFLQRSSGDINGNSSLKNCANNGRAWEKCFRDCLIISIKQLSIAKSIAKNSASKDILLA